MKTANGIKTDIIRLLWTTGALVFIAGMVLNPQIVFDGAVNGLKTWWNIVFPALLPFFIASELLMSFGVVHFMGVLLEPVMRPLFNVPGAGSFVMAVGFSSGYPIGSMITAKLRSQRLCTRVEAERLMSFTNNASPLFMLVAVAVGMFNSPALGWLIAGAHYLSNITLGLLLRFYARHDPELIPAPITPKQGWLPGQAFRQMLRIQRQENRPPGKIIGDAVHNAVTNLLNIGGFIILFAVLIKMLTTAGIIDNIAGILGLLLLPLGFSQDILIALAGGFWEMTIGCKMAGETAAPLLQQVIAVSMILGWSGLSVHAQAAGMISKTDIRMLPFVLTRIAHSFLAGLYCYLLFLWYNPYTAVSTIITGTADWHGTSYILFNLKLCGLFLSMIAAIMLVAAACHLIRNLKYR